MKADLGCSENTLQDPDAVMREYKRTGDLKLRNQLVLHYTPQINAAIYSMRSMLLSNIPAEDFFNQGVLTLIEKIDRFQPERGVRFDTYIYKSLRGAMVNYVRKQNWLPNRVWSMGKQLRQVQSELENRLLRTPTSQELADEMHISTAELERLLIEMNAADSVSYEELLEQSIEPVLAEGQTAQDELSNVLKKERCVQLANAIEQLPARHKQVIALCYYENLNLREIGEVLGLTQQRVSQLRASALQKLHEALKEYEEN